MEAKIVKGQLVLTIDLEKDPKPSKSGKTLVVASSHGNVKTGVQYKGAEIVVGLNAYIKQEA